MVDSETDKSIVVGSKEAIQSFISELDYFRSAPVDLDEELYEFELHVDNVAIALAQLELVELEEEREPSLESVVRALTDAGIVDRELVKAVQDLQSAMARVAYDMTDSNVKVERDQLTELLDQFVSRLQGETVE